MIKQIKDNFKQIVVLLGIIALTIFAGYRTGQVNKLKQNQAELVAELEHVYCDLSVMADSKIMYMNIVVLALADNWQSQRPSLMDSLTFFAQGHDTASFQKCIPMLSQYLDDAEAYNDSVSEANSPKDEEIYN